MSESVEYKKTNVDALRADVTETTNVLKITVDKLVDRGDRLDALTAKADELNTSSAVYHKSSGRLRRRMQWQNYKITIFIVVVVVVVIAVIVLVATHPWSK